MDLQRDFEISQATYEWTGRIITILKKILRVNLKLHQSKDQVNAGEIFLFNHFTRFETFIPQHLIYQESGAVCRTVAASNFFVEGSQLSNYLLNIGAVPNNHPRLLPFLAEEILRGRKVIIFPEGGMVKDHRVLDSKGRYSIYSPTAMTTRKHHSGAAVLALMLDVFKMAIRQAHEAGNLSRLHGWVETLGLPDKEALIAAALRPTLIVPGTITFYPIRVNDNVLTKIGDLLGRGLSRGLSEELRIEGNILLKDTDMDVRLGESVRPSDLWRWWDRKFISRLARKIGDLDGLFRLTRGGGVWKERLLSRRMRDNAAKIRDECMHRMYTGVTVNLSHLASLIILSYADEGQTEVDQTIFQKALYLAVKNAQKESSIHLHQSLENPDAYGGLVDGQCAGLDQLLTTAASMNLVASEKGRLRFLPKLRKEDALDEIRLENLVAVYANEVAPLKEVIRSARRAMEEAPALDKQRLATLRFDDELRAHAWDKKSFSEEQHEEINIQETVTESGEPFLSLPANSDKPGIVLVHGFSASPAEVRPFAQKLMSLGYPVIGVRLKGHGTAPWDLCGRSWQDWLESVRRGYGIMAAFARRVCLVGFSTGGALSLRLAADAPQQLLGVAAIAVPMWFRDRTMIFAPLVHGANELVRRVSPLEGVMLFRKRTSEHPHINYRNVPVRGLHELNRLIADLEEHLPKVQCPVILLQSTDDPIVEPKSAELIHGRLGTTEKKLVMIPASQHGILYEDIGATQETITSFLATLCGSVSPEPKDEGAPAATQPADGERAQQTGSDAAKPRTQDRGHSTIS